MTTIAYRLTATATVVWSRKTATSSTASNTRTLAIDSTSTNVYLATDISQSYIALCMIRVNDGYALYCLKIDGDGSYLPYDSRLLRLCITSWLIIVNGL